MNNTDYTVRRAAPAEAPIITSQRRAMFEDMGQADAARLDAMDAAFEPWVAERLAAGTYIGWLAEGADGAVVAGAGLWVMDWPPHQLGQEARRGNILNVYVAPDHRRRGLARRLMDVVLAYCRADGLEVVVLHARDQGRPLYQALGFTPTNEMRLLLAQG
jgi:ribosomal protein S18 acetylase RimI-like enzyme